MKHEVRKMKLAQFTFVNNTNKILPSWGTHSFPHLLGLTNTSPQTYTDIHVHTHKTHGLHAEGQQERESTFMGHLQR